MENCISGTVCSEHGGSGFDTLSCVLVVEELAKACASTALGYAAHISLGLTPIYLFGTKAQREKYVPQLCRGVDDNGKLTLGCFGLTEPGAGSDAGGTKTRADKKDGHWVVNGRKAFFSWVLREETLNYWHFAEDTLRRPIPAHWRKAADLNLTKS